MNGKSTNSWQVILADLSLILFLIAIAGYGVSQAKEGTGRAFLVGEDSQAIFRDLGGAPDLADWLATQQIDQRAQLTIVATYLPENSGPIWAKAQRLFSEAQSAGYTARIIMESGENDDTYVIVAFDRTENRL